jgi:hypothetical protein
MKRGAPALRARANTHTRVVSTRPETLLMQMQMQGCAAVAAAETQADDLIGEVVRAGRTRIRETREGRGVSARLPCRAG